MSALVSLPVIWPLTLAVLLLALHRWPRVQRGLALGGGVLVLALAAFLLWRVRRDGILVHAVSGWPPPFGIILVADLLSTTLLLVTAGVFLAALIYSLGALRPEALRLSYLPLFFFLMTGVNGAFLTGDIFNLFVFFEVMLLAIYGLVITHDPDGLVPRAEKLEATFKYLVLNLIGAAVMLLAIGTLYGTTGTLNMADLSVRIRDLRAAGVAHLDVIALLFVAVFGLKAAAAPFHFWLPDVHPSAPTPVSAILSGILIKVGAYGMIRLTSLLFVGLGVLGEVVLFLGIATVLLGGLLAVGQRDVKRLLAYSSVSQMGFLFLAIGLASAQAVAAAVFFLVNHALIKSMMFLTAGGVMHLTHERSMDRMGGLVRASPFLATTFLVGSMALAGLPPLNGFVSKLLVFQALIDGGRLAYVLAALVGAFLSLLYTFRAWLRIFWGEGHVAGGLLHPSALLPIGGLAGLCLLLGLFPEPLVDLVTQVGLQATTPEIYVDAVLGGLP